MERDERHELFFYEEPPAVQHVTHRITENADHWLTDMTLTEAGATPSGTGLTSTDDHQYRKSVTAAIPSSGSVNFHTTTEVDEGFCFSNNSEDSFKVFISKQKIEKASPSMFEKIQRQPNFMDNDEIGLMLVLFDITHGGTQNLIPEKILNPELHAIPRHKTWMPKTDDIDNPPEARVVEVFAWAAWEIRAEDIYHKMVNYLGFICMIDKKGNILRPDWVVEEPMIECTKTGIHIQKAQSRPQVRKLDRLRRYRQNPQRLCC
ncbi:hypothetical protein CSAL01_08740 [Colletotrichum salicis]|uniref:Uncharacterized protein n=1 Tax=Colletotrichum salicis TaxID=1209931 RepID=A0A135V3C2_9PEZI|nr:hypothetical protein CSAL01_08740 [Colletotrichum salicis]